LVVAKKLNTGVSTGSVIEPLTTYKSWRASKQRLSLIRQKNKRTKQYCNYYIETLLISHSMRNIHWNCWLTDIVDGAA